MVAAAPRHRCTIAALASVIRLSIEPRLSEPRPARRFPGVEAEGRAPAPPRFENHRPASVTTDVASVRAIRAIRAIRVREILLPEYPKRF